MAEVTTDPTLTIAEDMRRLPKEARRAARPKLRAAGGLIADGAKANASWSDRIPATVRVSTSFRVDREGVTVIAGGANAPHARPFEGSRVNPFRHPVRGGPAWVDQAARPFLIPAGRSGAMASEPMMHEALAEAAAAIGFTG